MVVDDVIAIGNAKRLITLGKKKCSRLMLKLLLLNTMIKTAEVSYCCLEKLLLLSIITTASTRVNAAEGLLLLEDLMLSEKMSRPYQRKDKDELKIKIRINGNSFKPVAQITTNADGSSTSLIPGPVTNEEKVQKKNDVKERSMLLMALPNEHLMTFNQYKDAQTLFAAIQTRFGGNEATKKTQKTLLKQMYENFSASSTESLNSIFNRLQKIVSQPAVFGENISQEDLNMKFLRSLPSEWNTHVVVWRNKPDLDTMSFDDLYNNFKIVEQEVKGTTNSSSISNSQNKAFVSSPSNTNEVDTAYGVSTANLSDATVYAFVANQPNGSQLVHEDLEQIHKDDLEEIDLKWQYDKTKVECFNCHKMGHFARECKGPRNHDSRNRNQDRSRRNVHVKNLISKAMLAIDGAGFDWSYMADDEVPLNMALMAFLDSEIYNDKTWLASVEEQLVFYKKNEVIFSDQIAVLKRDISFKDSGVLNTINRESANDNSRKGCGRSSKALSLEDMLPKTSKSVSEYISNEVRESPDSLLVEELVLHDKNMAPRAVLMKTGLRPLNTARPVNTAHPKNFINTAKEKLYTARPKGVNTARPNSAVVNAVRANKGHPQKKYQGYFDSGCSRHMTGNMSYLSDFKEFDGGYVTFLGGAKGMGKLLFLEEKPIISGNGPKWLYDIDVLTKLMNYVPVVAGTNINNFVGTEESISVGHSSKETRSSQDYILMPLWKDGSLFDSSSKNTSNDEPQPFSDAREKDDGGVSKGSGIDDQEWPENRSQDINTAGLSINTAITNDNTDNSTLEAIHVDFFGDESEVDMSNIDTAYPVPSTPNTRIHKDHSLDYVIGDIQSGVQTRRTTKTTNEQGFLSAVYEGKTHKDLHTCLFAGFLSQKEPKRIAKALSDLAWVFKNKKDKRGIVIKNKARLVAQGYTQEEGIDYDEVFSPIARIKAIRLFLAYASFMVFIDVLRWCPCVRDNGTGGEGTLLFCIKLQEPSLISSIGELTFFLRMKVKRKEDGIFTSQDKYVTRVLRKFNFIDVKTSSTLMDTKKALLKDSDGDDVDVHLYRSMTGSLMYLTSSRPDIMFTVCACARFQVTPKVSYLHAVKRIFRYLNGQPKLGLWYPRDSLIDLVAYADSDYAGASLDRKSTIGGCQFLGCRLISWQCKKQTVVATSTTKAEYVAAASCYGQVLWIHNQMLDYSSIQYALIVNPTVYVSCIDQFWSTGVVKKVNGEAKMHALIGGKRIIVSEATIRNTQTPPPTTTPTPITTTSIPTTSKPTPTPHQQTPSVHPSQPQKQRVRKPTRRKTEVTQPSRPEMVADEDVLIESNDPLSGEDRLKLSKLMTLCIQLSNIVLDLETTKTTQAKEIADLKIESSDDEETVLGDQEDASKQGKRIADINEDAGVTLDNTTFNADKDLFDAHDLEGEEVFIDEEVIKMLMRR
ncbi:putative ribonuclease H-like domain-containing protein [Tanacetum coccineum]